MSGGLQRLLERVQRVDRWHAVMRAAATAGAGIAVAVLAAVVVDAIFALTAAGLVVLDVLLIGLVGAAVAVVVRAFRRTRFEPRRVARLLEQRLGIDDSRFINAVDLGVGERAAGASDELRRLAVAQGETAAEGVAAERAVDKQPTRRALKIFAAVIGVLLVTGLAAPRLYTMGLPRLLGPTADRPPFTLLSFDVRTEPSQVHFGYDATIEATITGPTQPRRAAVVFADGDSRERAPMLRTAERRFTLPIERATDSRRFYIETADGRSALHELRVLPTPTFEAVTVEYEYPAYTGWPAESRRLDDRGVRALEGTRVRVRVEANLPLDRAKWELDDGRKVRLSPDGEDGRTAAGSFTLESSGSYRLSLIGADGHASRQAMEGPVKAVADEAPFVQIIDPDLRLAAPPGFSVPVRALAADDVAVERMELHHEVEGEAQPSERLDVERRREGREAEGRHTLSLSHLGVAEGDTVRGFVTAYDNHPEQPRSADSEPFIIRIVSEDEYRTLARQQYRAEHIAAEMQQLLARLEEAAERRDALIEALETLKAEIEQPPEGAGDDQREQLRQLSREIDAYADRLDRLAEAMRQRAEQYELYQFEEPYRQMLQQRAEQLEQQAATARERGEALPDGGPADIDAAVEELRRHAQHGEQHRDEVEMTERQLRQLVAAQRLQAEALRIIDIAERQREVSNRLSRYGRMGQLEGDELARARRIADHQQRLHDELGSVLDRLEATAVDSLHLLPTMANTGRELVDEVRELNVEHDQAIAAQLARDGVGGTAWSRADTAARKLESLQSAGEAMTDPASLAEVDNPLNLSEPQMSESMSQIASAEAAEGDGEGTGAGEGVAGAGEDAGDERRGPGSPTDGFSAAPPGASARAASQTATMFEPGSAGFGGTGEGTPLAGEDRSGRAEVLQVEDAERRRSAPPHAAGVPLQFREMTQQYFRRLAEDSR